MMDRSKLLDRLDYFEWFTAAYLAKELDEHPQVVTQALAELHKEYRVERGETITDAGRYVSCWRLMHPDWLFGKPEDAEA